MQRTWQKRQGNGVQSLQLIIYLSIYSLLPKYKCRTLCNTISIVERQLSCVKRPSTVWIKLYADWFKSMLKTVLSSVLWKHKSNIWLLLRVWPTILFLSYIMIWGLRYQAVFFFLGGGVWEITRYEHSEQQKCVGGGGALIQVMVREWNTVQEGQLWPVWVTDPWSNTISKDFTTMEVVTLILFSVVIIVVLQTILLFLVVCFCTLVVSMHGTSGYPWRQVFSSCSEHT